MIRMQQLHGIRRKYPPVKDVSETPKLWTFHVGTTDKTWAFQDNLGVQPPCPFTLHLSSRARAAQSRPAVSSWSSYSTTPYRNLVSTISFPLSQEAAEILFQNTVCTSGKSHLSSEMLLPRNTWYCETPSCLTRNLPWPTSQWPAWWLCLLAMYKHSHLINICSSLSMTKGLTNSFHRSPRWVGGLERLQMGGLWTVPSSATPVPQAGDEPCRMLNLS